MYVYNRQQKCSPDSRPSPLTLLVLSASAPPSTHHPLQNLYLSLLSGLFCSLALPSPSSSLSDQASLSLLSVAEGSQML